MIRNQPRDAAVFGVDIGKNIFHIVGIDEAGRPIQRVRVRRDTLLQFFARAKPAIVGMEACPGSQWLARKLNVFGHTVRIIPAQFVKPYLKSNKNDTLDAEAIAEASTRPTMRFVDVKSVEQIDVQALHRTRDMMVTQRTRMISQMRAFCLEYGATIRQGAGVFKLDLPRVISDTSNDLSPAIRRLLAELFDDMMRLEHRIGEITREIEALVAQSDVARRLMTILGIGPLSASALLAAAGRGHQFKKARGLAWPRTPPILDRRQIDLDGDQQARQWLCTPPFHSRSSIVRSAPRPDEEPSWRVGRPAAAAYAHQQGRGRFGKQDRSHRMGNSKPSWRALRTG